MDAVSPITERATLWRLGHMIDAHAETAPGSTALMVGDQRRRITYADLAELVVDHCAALLRRGLHSGDVIGLRSSNSIEFVVALLGAARADIVVATLDPALPWTERRARMDRVGARAVLTDARRPDPIGGEADCPEWCLHITTSGAKPEMQLLAPDPGRDVASPLSGLTNDDALIMFTSGTTGSPKLVPWTHGNMAASLDGVASAYQLSPADATVAAMPLFHGHGLIAAMLATLSTGGAVVLPARGRFSAHTFWDDLAAVGATWYTAVPTIHQILLERAPADRRGYRGRLRFIRSCSAPLSTVTMRRMETVFDAPVLAAYGMTETTHQASTVLLSDDERTRMQTVGKPTGLSVRIVDDKGITCPQGASGEIWLQGPAVVRGYLGDAAANATTVVDGWVRTGDLGVVDGNGRVVVQGRIKDQINRGGEKISPERVEEILIAHPGVTEAAVFGVSDALYGEHVGAIVVRRRGSDLDAAGLTAFCRQHLAPFEIPEQITFADQLPLTAKGSVDRAKLADLVASR